MLTLCIWCNQNPIFIVSIPSNRGTLSNIYYEQNSNRSKNVSIPSNRGTLSNEAACLKLRIEKAEVETFVETLVEAQGAIRRLVNQ